MNTPGDNAAPQAHVADAPSEPLACGCGLKACSSMFARLTPGTRAFISVSGLKDKVECAVLGFKKNQFIILSLPGCASAASPELLSLLYNGNIVTLFLVIEGKIAVLESHVVRLTMDPAPILFVSFPMDCSIVNLRQSLRIKCMFRAVITAGERQMSGMITDLSCGGCGFVCASRRCASFFRVGQSVSIECDQLCPQKSCMAIVACICSNVSQEQSVRIGLRFQECSMTVQNALKDFVEEATSLGQTC